MESSSLTYTAPSSQQGDTGGFFFSELRPSINQPRHPNQSGACTDQSFMLQLAISSILPSHQAGRGPQGFEITHRKALLRLHHRGTLQPPVAAQLRGQQGQGVEEKKLGNAPSSHLHHQPSIYLTWCPTAYSAARFFIVIKKKKRKLGMLMKYRSQSGENNRETIATLSGTSPPSRVPPSLRAGKQG